VVAGADPHLGVQRAALLWLGNRVEQRRAGLAQRRVAGERAQRRVQVAGERLAQRPAMLGSDELFEQVADLIRVIVGCQDQEQRQREVGQAGGQPGRRERAVPVCNEVGLGGGKFGMQCLTIHRRYFLQ